MAVGWAGYSSVTNAEPAFASWTAVPAAATPHDVTVARDACRRGLRAGPSLARLPLDWGAARLALAERRGAFVAVVLRTVEPDVSLHCLVRNDPGSPDAEVIDASGGAGAGTPRERPASIPPDAIGEFTFTDRFDRGGAAMADGLVGTGVTAVTLHVGAVAVQATVHDGLFAAWWPTKGPLSRSLANGPRAITRVDLTLADGRVIRDALADGRVIRDAVPRHLP